MKELLLKIQRLLSRYLSGGGNEAMAAASAVALSILEEDDLFGGDQGFESGAEAGLAVSGPIDALTAAGAACALKKKGMDGVVVAWVNVDGLERALSLAAALNLPLILLLNCRLSELDELDARVMAVEDATCIPADGRSVMKLMPSVRLAVDRAREGDGPTLIECVADQADDEDEAGLTPLERLNNVLVFEGYALPEELQ